jgi:hypothetical protein
MFSVKNLEAKFFIFFLVNIKIQIFNFVFKVREVRQLRYVVFYLIIIFRSRYT